MKNIIMIFILISFFIISCKKENDTPPSTSCTSTCLSVQCSGITQDGSRCLRMTTACCGRCWQHEQQIIDERTNFVGNWLVTDNCSLSGSYSYSVTISISPLTADEIEITNFWGTFSNKAIAKINGTTITIIRQQPDLDMYFIQGNGDINASGNTINWNYSVSDETNSQYIMTDVCNSTWIKQ